LAERRQAVQAVDATLQGYASVPKGSFKAPMFAGGRGSGKLP
jgi:hypothetical protein